MNEQMNISKSLSSPQRIICSHVCYSNTSSFSISGVLVGKRITSEFSVTMILECLRIFYMI